jgi:ParB-like chromosome segregation protein Spo0J
MILDGRNRWRACQALGIKVAQTDWARMKTRSPISFPRTCTVVSLVNPSARVAARIASFKHGADHRSDQVAHMQLDLTREKVGGLLNVSPSVLSNARLILEKGSPTQIAAVEGGAAAVSSIARHIKSRLPKSFRANLKKEHGQHADFMAKKEEVQICNSSITRTKAGELLNVSKRSISDARLILEKGCPPG